MVAFAEARDIALALPEVEEGTSYGTPAFKVRRKLLARLREDGETLVVKVPMVQREALLQAEPEVYFTTPHYDGYPCVLVRLGIIGREALRDLLLDAWAFTAPKRLVAQHDAESEVVTRQHG